MDVRNKVQDYLRRSGMPPTRFGRVVARDPRLVGDIRNGRTIGPKLAARIANWLEANAR